MDISQRYCATNNCELAENKVEEALNVLFTKEEERWYDGEQQMMAIIMTMAHLLPAGHSFETPEIAVDSIMNIMVKSTAMGPMNLLSSNPVVMDSIQRGRKTDRQDLCKMTIEEDIRRVNAGQPPVIRPFGC